MTETDDARTLEAEALMTARTSRIGALIEELTADRARLAAAVEHVPVPLRSQRPAPDRWSVAEILEHLVIIEQRAATIVRELAASAPACGAEAAGDGGMQFDRSILRDRSVRVMAPPMIQPTGTMDAATAWKALQVTRTVLLDEIRAAEGRDLAAVSRAHPRLGPLTGYEWIAALGGHEERHTAQIAEIAETLASGTSAAPPPA